MKNAFATIIGTSVLTAGIVSMSAMGASAASLIGVFDGNDDKSPVTYQGVTYDYFGKFDVDGAKFDDAGNLFTIDLGDLDDGEAKAGTASAGTGAGVFAVKAGRQYALYFTEDLSSISWNTSDLGNKGLSHLSIWQGPGGGPQKEVPEPLTLLGSGLALGFGGYFQKKRNAKKSA
jgi:hypothetical protein